MTRKIPQSAIRLPQRDRMSRQARWRCALTIPRVIDPALPDLPYDGHRGASRWRDQIGQHHRRLRRGGVVAVPAVAARVGGCG